MTTKQDTPRDPTIQQVIAQSGLTSRRKALDLVKEGKVTINQKLAKPGDRVKTKDKVKVNNRPLKSSERPVVCILNKPKNVLSTVSDDRGRPTVTDYIKSQKRLYPVGRLDFESEGLMLLTNDGELAHRLMHPRYKIRKIYQVVTRGQASNKDCQKMIKGVKYNSQYLYALDCKLIKQEHGNSTLKFTLNQGKKRQIRYMLSSANLPVIMLKRIQIGPIKLGELKSGQSRFLSATESEALYKAVSLTLN